MTPAPAFVLLNPRAGSNSAARRWPAVARALPPQFSGPIVELDREGRWREAVAKACAASVRSFVAAGGDGTVGSLVDALLSERGATSGVRPTVAAVGLGSSNDYHKPFQARESGVPVRVGPATVPTDVGLARWTDPAGRQHQRHFAVSASLGLCAEGNRLFNTAAATGAFVRRLPSAVAITRAALSAIARHRNIDATIRVDDETLSVAASNISFGKTPWVSGGLRYDGPTVLPSDGLLSVHLCHDMSRLGLLRVLLDLSRGHFGSALGRRSWRAAGCDVHPKRPITLELDGETTLAAEISIRVIPQSIDACR